MISGEEFNLINGLTRVMRLGLKNVFIDFLKVSPVRSGAKGI